MTFNLIISKDSIPKGEALKRDAEIYIGTKRINVSSPVKQFVQDTQTALGHQYERDTVVHLLTALAVSAKKHGNRNRSNRANLGSNREGGAR